MEPTQAPLYPSPLFLSTPPSHEMIEPEETDVIAFELNVGPDEPVQIHVQLKTKKQKALFISQTCKERVSFTLRTNAVPHYHTQICQPRYPFFPSETLQTEHSVSGPILHELLSSTLPMEEILQQKNRERCTTRSMALRCKKISMKQMRLQNSFPSHPEASTQSSKNRENRTLKKTERVQLEHSVVAQAKQEEKLTYQMQQLALSMEKE